VHFTLLQARCAFCALPCSGCECTTLVQRSCHLHPSLALRVPYVVSRQLSTGDQLRVIYENLSKDPNSLANLDQVGC